MDWVDAGLRCIIRVEGGGRAACGNEEGLRSSRTHSLRGGTVPWKERYMYTV